MDYLSNKNREKPTHPCIDKENCFRKNVHHFMEYAHDHLEKIIVHNGHNEIENYDVPEEFMSNKSIYLDQIKIINNLFPKPLSNEPCAKRCKIEIIDLTEPDVIPNAKRDVKPLQTATQQPNIQSSSRSSPKSVLDKLNAAKPYNYFLTAIESSPRTHSESLSITFQEILDPSLGEIESSVQINYVVQLDWLLEQYRQANCLDKPILILNGDNEILSQLPQVKTHLIKPDFGSHHTKMMLLCYKDGSMRVVVSTANLYAGDWHNYVQGLWISDQLPSLSKNTAPCNDGESATGFRDDLIKYLTAYGLPDLSVFIARIRNTDFSSVNVFLVTSVPGTFKKDEVNGYQHGHGRVECLLSQYSEPIEDTTPLVIQCSTFGKLTFKSDYLQRYRANWFNADFVDSLRCDRNPKYERKNPPIIIIYPTFDNVQHSYDGLMGGGCLLYDKKRHDEQPTWLNNAFHQWRADARYRTRAMPHIKTYCRWSANKLFWFILTSANLSRSAWGYKWLKDFKINNYEAGVMFLPLFVTQTAYFSLDVSDRTTPVFPKLYDTPLTKYNSGDRPYFADEALPNE